MTHEPCHGRIVIRGNIGYINVDGRDELEPTMFDETREQLTLLEDKLRLLRRRL